LCTASSFFFPLAGKDAMWTHYADDYYWWMVMWWIFAVPTMFASLDIVYQTSFYQHAIVDHVHYIAQVRSCPLPPQAAPAPTPCPCPLPPAPAPLVTSSCLGVGAPHAIHPVKKCQCSGT
jgi:hypothetical protein